MQEFLPEGKDGAHKQKEKTHYKMGFWLSKVANHLALFSAGFLTPTAGMVRNTVLQTVAQQSTSGRAPTRFSTARENSLYSLHCLELLLSDWQPWIFEGAISSGSHLF